MRMRMIVNCDITPQARRDLPAGTSQAAAREFHFRNDRRHSGDRGGVTPRHFEVIVFPNVASKMNHPSIDRDVDVPRIDIRVREQCGLNSAGNVSVRDPFGRSPRPRRRTGHDCACGHYGDHGR